MRGNALLSSSLQVGLSHRAYTELIVDIAITSVAIVIIHVYIATASVDISISSIASVDIAIASVAIDIAHVDTAMTSFAIHIRGVIQSSGVMYYSALSFWLLLLLLDTLSY